MKQVLPASLACLICGVLLGCSFDSITPKPSHAHSSQTDWKQQYKLGVRSARSDLAHGSLAWETHDNGEWKDHRITWCFRKILAEKYGIEYRIRGHFCTGDNDARISGYQSVMDPHLSTQLGADWRQRINAEAKAFYAAHWREVERQYFIDEPEQPGYEDYVRRHPITEEERRTRNPLDKFYDYRDNQAGLQP